MDAISNKESVTGVVRMVGAVKKVGLEMDVMVPLGALVMVVTDAYLNQVI